MHKLRTNLRQDVEREKALQEDAQQRNNNRRLTPPPPNSLTLPISQLQAGTLSNDIVPFRDRNTVDIDDNYIDMDLPNSTLLPDEEDPFDESNFDFFSNMDCNFDDDLLASINNPQNSEAVTSPLSTNDSFTSSQHYDNINSHFHHNHPFSTSTSSNFQQLHGNNIIKNNNHNNNNNMMLKQPSSSCPNAEPFNLPKLQQNEGLFLGENESTLKTLLTGDFSQQQQQQQQQQINPQPQFLLHKIPMQSTSIISSRPLINLIARQAPPPPQQQQQFISASLTNNNRTKEHHLLSQEQPPQYTFMKSPTMAGVAANTNAVSVPIIYSHHQPPPHGAHQVVHVAPIGGGGGVSNSINIFRNTSFQPQTSSTNSSFIVIGGNNDASQSQSLNAQMNSLSPNMSSAFTASGRIPPQLLPSQDASPSRTTKKANGGGGGGDSTSSIVGGASSNTTRSTSVVFGDVEDMRLKLKKQSHNEVERRRRENINRQILTLGELLPAHLFPNGESGKRKGTILRATVAVLQQAKHNECTLTNAYDLLYKAKEILLGMRNLYSNLLSCSNNYEDRVASTKELESSESSHLVNNADLWLKSLEKEEARIAMLQRVLDEAATSSNHMNVNNTAIFHQGLQQHSPSMTMVPNNSNIGRVVSFQSSEINDASHMDEQDDIFSLGKEQYLLNPEDIKIEENDLVLTELLTQQHRMDVDNNDSLNKNFMNIF